MNNSVKISFIFPNTWFVLHWDRNNLPKLVENVETAWAGAATGAKLHIGERGTVGSAEYSLLGMIGYQIEEMPPAALTEGQEKMASVMSRYAAVLEKMVKKEEQGDEWRDGGADLPDEPADPE